MQQEPTHRSAAQQPHLPRFDTGRFAIVPLTPPKLRALAQILLQDPPLAEALPWMQDKTADGASREAFLLELECTSGTTSAWGIVERARGMFIGAVLARQTLTGLDIEVLCASQFWNQGVADEVYAPVAEWLEEHAETPDELLQ